MNQPQPIPRVPKTPPPPKMPGTPGKRPPRDPGTPGDTPTRRRIVNRGPSAAHQQGISMIGLLFVLGMGIFFAMLAFKSLPAWNEYMAVKRALNQIEVEGETNVATARKTFDRFAEVDRIESIKGADITFVKGTKGLKGEYEYESRVHVAGNMSLVYVFASK